MTRRVKFDFSGIAKIGEYLPGIEYDVEEAEAARLVTVKGFVYVDEGE